MMESDVEIRNLGDRAIEIVVAGEPGEAAFERVQGMAEKVIKLGHPAVVEVVPALTSVAVHLGAEADWAEVEAEIRKVLRRSKKLRWTIGARRRKDRVREIDVEYGGDSGPDLARVAEATGLSEAEVIERHTTGRYRVLALGFAPGFAYLWGLEKGLQCARLETPRTRVEAGSVGIGGAQTGVYPVTLPGGWNIIGKTGQRMFDAAAEVPNWLQAGDVVTFKKVEAVKAVVASGDGAEPAGGGALEVRDGGLQTTVQDLGRRGFQSIGVTEGGAVDRVALRVANLLVGNAQDAAGLEWGGKGPKLLFHERRVVAITGAVVDGVAHGRPVVVEAGDVLDLSRVKSGNRGYVAVDGGFEVPEVMGSRGTHVAGEFGGLDGRALKKGDRLACGEGAVDDVGGGWWAAADLVRPGEGGEVAVRVLRGPEAEEFGDAGWEALVGEGFTVRSDSDRMGLRLEGGAIGRKPAGEMVSGPVVAGTVQVPADGQPIVLLADRQSLGGYPRIATVASADLRLVAQAAPGTRVRFVECDLAEAEAARVAQERSVRLLAVGARSKLG